MKRTVRQRRTKAKDWPQVEATEAPPEPIDTRVALVQALIPVVLERVAELLKEDVIAAAGARYARGDHAPTPLVGCRPAPVPVSLPRRRPGAPRLALARERPVLR